MRKVISFRLERKLQIIQYLYEEREVQSIKEIVNAVKVSEKTIRADISHINENFPFLCIEIGSKGRVKLHCQNYVGIGHVYRKAMDISLEFKFFEHLLSGENHSISQYLEKFFMSESTFRRIIKKWNQTFANRNLPVSISTSPTVTIQGDEMVVRRLFHRYMMEKYEGNFQSSFSGEMSGIWELITRIWNILGEKISYATHLKLSYWAFVSMKRIQQGYFTKKDFSENKKKIARLLYAEISKDSQFTRQFAHENQVGLSEDVLLDMMEISNYEQKESELSVKAVKDFLSALYESVYYQDSFLEETSIAVYDSLVFQNGTPFFFYDYTSEFKEYVKRENSRFLKIFETNLERSTLPDDLKQKDELKNGLLYDVVIYSESLLEKVDNQIIQKKILILTTYYDKYTHWVQGKIEDRFTGDVVVSLYQSNRLYLDMDYINQFDIILTNYENLPGKLASRIIYLDAGISGVFWEKLKNALFLSEGSTDRNVSVVGK